MRCIAYGLQFNNLTLDIYNHDRRTYEFCKIDIMLTELQEKSFKVQKWNKPTRRGTYVKFKAVESKDEFKSELEKIREYVEQRNKEFDFDFIMKKGE